jgi:PAS domain S-box-containing protein
MSRRNLEEMSKEALIRELEKTEAAGRRFAESVGEHDRERLILDLHVHQVELEMQNRELREAQQRLEEATSRYSDLYDFAPVGYCTLGPDGRISELNLTAAALFGAPREALVGGPFSAVAPLKERRPFHAHMRRCQAETGRVTSELAFSVGTRETRFVRIISDPVRTQTGVTIAYRTILVDISDLKVLENRLRLLSTAGERLGASVEYALVIEKAASIAVPELADICMIDVASASGAVERRVVLFADPKKQETFSQTMMRFTSRTGWQTPQALVIASGDPMLLSEVSADLRGRISADDADADALRAADVRSLMVVPLAARGRTFGALTLASAESDKRYSSIDLQVAQALAGRIAMALDNARLYDEAQRANDALRLSEAKSSGIVSIAADAIISIDRDQRIALFNEGAETIFGYSKAEIIGAPLEILLPERFRARHRQHIERFASGAHGGRGMGERGRAILGLRKNGQEFPADAAISMLEVGGERILTVALRDVTDAKRFESDQKLLADMGPALAGTLDYDETLTRVGELVVRALADFCIVEAAGEEDGEIRRLVVVARDPEKQWICDALRLAPIGPSRSLPHPVGTTQSILIEEVTPERLASWAEDDEQRRVLREMAPKFVMTVPLFARGKIVGYLKVVSSTGLRASGVEDLRLMEAIAYRAALAIDNARLYRVAARAIRARDDVLGVVAHDLRNPLNGILMAVQLLEPRPHEPERRSRTPVNVIQRSATRMNRMIEDLLDIVRMEAGRLGLEQAPVDAGKVLPEFVESLRAIASSKSLELRLDVAQSLGEAFADRDRLLQVLENLAGNSMKFTKSGGCITVGAAPRNGELLFWVADTGAGIASAHLPHLFDRFWQASKPGRHGVGLGLPIVKGIVEAHGGRIWVESQLGAGSTFFFTIPRGAPHAEASALPHFVH